MQLSKEIAEVRSMLQQVVPSFSGRDFASVTQGRVRLLQAVRACDNQMMVCMHELLDLCELAHRSVGFPAPFSTDHQYHTVNPEYPFKFTALCVQDKCTSIAALMQTMIKPRMTSALRCLEETDKQQRGFLRIIQTLIEQGDPYTALHQIDLRLVRGTGKSGAPTGENEEEGKGEVATVGHNHGEGGGGGGGAKKDPRATVVHDVEDLRNGEAGLRSTVGTLKEWSVQPKLRAAGSGSGPNEKEREEVEEEEEVGCSGGGGELVKRARGSVEPTAFGLGCVGSKKSAKQRTAALAAKLQACASDIMGDDVDRNVVWLDPEGSVEELQTVGDIEKMLRNTTSAGDDGKETWGPGWGPSSAGDCGGADKTRYLESVASAPFPTATDENVEGMPPPSVPAKFTRSSSSSSLEIQSIGTLATDTLGLNTLEPDTLGLNTLEPDTLGLNTSGNRGRKAGKGKGRGKGRVNNKKKKRHGTKKKKKK